MASEAGDANEENVDSHPWQWKRHLAGILVLSFLPLAAVPQVPRNRLTAKDQARVRAALRTVERATGIALKVRQANVMSSPIERSSLRVTANAGLTLLEVDRETGTILLLYLGRKCPPGRVWEFDRIVHRAGHMAQVLSDGGISGRLHPYYGVVNGPGGKELSFSYKSPGKYPFNQSCIPTVSMRMSETGYLLDYSGTVLKFTWPSTLTPAPPTGSTWADWSPYWGGTPQGMKRKQRIELVSPQGIGRHGSFRRDAKLMLGERSYQPAYVYDLGDLAQVWIDPKSGSAIGGVFSLKQRDVMYPHLGAKVRRR